MSHLHVLTEHLVQPTQGSGQEGLGIQALMDLLVQWEETSSRHTHDTHGAGGGECSEGRRAAVGAAAGRGCFREGGLRRPPRVGRGHGRASEGGRRGSREGLWGPCPRQQERRPHRERLECWRAGLREAGLAGVRSPGEASGKGLAQMGPASRSQSLGRTLSREGLIWFVA